MTKLLVEHITIQKFDWIFEAISISLEEKCWHLYEVNIAISI